MIYKGEQAKAKLEAILSSRPEPPYAGEPVAGYWEEGATVVAFDNRGGNCWVEEFGSTKEAINWIKGK